MDVEIEEISNNLCNAKFKKLNDFHIIRGNIGKYNIILSKSGDTVIADKMVQHDFDVTAFGNPKRYMDKGIEPDKPTIYYSDKNLIKKFTKDKTLITVTAATGNIFKAKY